MMVRSNAHQILSLMVLNYVAKCLLLSTLSKIESVWTTPRGGLKFGWCLYRTGTWHAVPVRRATSEHQQELRPFRHQAFTINPRRGEETRTLGPVCVLFTIDFVVKYYIGRSIALLEHNIQREQAYRVMRLFATGRVLRMVDWNSLQHYKKVTGDAPCNQATR